jgi:FMN phosphatase YigB (HAD superfamily)
VVHCTGFENQRPQGLREFKSHPFRNMKKIKFIYFDLGGVIVDHISGLIKTAEKFNLDKVEVISLFKKHANDLDRGLLSLGELEEIFDKKFDISNKLDKKLGEFIVDNFKIIQETHDLIYEIANDISIGILSNVSEDIFNYVEKNKLIPSVAYDSLIVSAKLKVIKPEKKIFDIALSKSKYSLEEVLFIDDKLENIDAAKSLGWKTVLFETNNPQKSVNEIKRVIGLDI